MLNKIMLMGRFTKDADLKYTKDGKAYARFSIATQRDYNKNEVDFFNCVAFGKKAEFISKYFSKGSLILITGHVQVGSYEDDNKVKHQTFDVIVDETYFAGDNKNSQSQSQSQSQIDCDDDLPF